MKIFKTLLYLFVFTLAIVDVNADNFFKGARKRHQKMFHETNDAIKEVREAVLPPLVNVERGHHGRRHYDDVIYFPRGDYKGRDQDIYLDENFRPYRRSDGRYGNWRMSSLGCRTRATYPGMHFVIRLNDRWYCDAHHSYDCPIFRTTYYTTYDERYMVERSHDLWDSGYGDRQIIIESPGPRPTWHLGTGGRTRLQVDEGGVVTCKIHHSQDCAIVIGLLHGGTSYTYIGTRIINGAEHSAYCARGTRCD